MSLLNDLRSADKYGLFQSDDNYVMYGTGFPPLDYANGFWAEVTDSHGKTALVPDIGLMGGTFTGIIGATGTGKTTLADQIGYNIIRPFSDGLLIHIDAEKTSNKQRMMQICKAINDSKMILTKKHTSIDEVLAMVKEICDKKQAAGKSAMYEVKRPNARGEKFMMYAPTVIIIDSLPAFNSKGFNRDDLGTNADGMRAAKDTTRFYTNCLDSAWEYNINFFVINHIKPLTEVNPYAKPPRGLLLLGPGEMLPRGQVAQYYSQTYFRVNQVKSEAYLEADYGFTGSRRMIQLTKSKTNSIGAKIPLAFIDTLGFDPAFSMYEYASSLGLIRGRNPNLYFDGCESFKFNRKDFRRLYLYEDKFREIVWKSCTPFLEAMLSEAPTRIRAEEFDIEAANAAINIPVEYRELDSGLVVPASAVLEEAA